MTAYVLVLNAGSSSLKYSLIDALTGEPAGSGLVERIGEEQGRLKHDGPQGRTERALTVPTHEAALGLVVETFREHGPHLAEVHLVAVGHRVVHGGTAYSAPSLIDDALVATVERLVPLAPLHNPANLEGIAVARRLLDAVPHVAVFDTAFHQTLPAAAYTYAVPRSWTEDHHVRRYGFHGTSVSFVSRTAAEVVDVPVAQCRSIVLHLGNGASATAVDGGRSVETSMGFTPLEGLVMGTRSGDVDPALPAYLERAVGLDIERIDRALNRESGLLGLSGVNDFRELQRLRADGDLGAHLAYDVYVHRLRKYVGAYWAVLGTVDAVVFTGGVGENNPGLRADVLAGLERWGAVVDPALNDVRSDEPRRISATDSTTAVLVVPTDEEWEIARQAYALVTG